jgi:uncharacterized protein
VTARRFCAGLALAILLGPLTSVVALAADFPVPPRPATEVVDAAGALSASTRDALETQLESFEAKTGHHVVVYIGQTTGNVPLETWTAETAQTWRVGQKGKDDGAVLFLFMKDHKVRIEVGYGLESTLTDANASQIIADAIVPKLKAGDTDGAVTAGVNGMLAAIDPANAPPNATGDSAQAATDDAPNPLVVLCIVLFVLALIFFIVMQVVTAIWYGHLIRREGKEAADADLRRSWLRMFMTGGGAGAGYVGGSFIGGGFSGGGGGGGFSGGSFGGSFGGGGASGSW